MLSLEDIPMDIIVEALRQQYEPEDLIELLGLDSDAILYYCGDELEKLIEWDDEDVKLAVANHYTLGGLEGDWEDWDG